ncbi:MAG: hypothetical protein DI547_13525 [Sphingobium sp.]|jgi:hypothetical protein|nr:MAG: hypothetical protein DI547_13525 [Sphingobium sp.]
MSAALVDALTEAFADLGAALDSDEVAAIDAATTRVNGAVAALKGVGAWREDAALKEKLKALLPVMEAARIRTSLLADHTRQRITLLADRGVSHAPLTYGR